MSQLQFKLLEFSNFKTFTGSHQFKLEQPPGLYFIQGKNLVDPELGANGVGKSTLFDALTWCLWGKTGRDNRPADAIKPWNGKGKTQVQLWFSRNGEDHFIYRTRNPNSLRHSVGASDDDKEVQQEDIPKILGMSEEMYRRTLVLGQFGTLFLDLKPEAQAQMFTEALDLNVWLRASDSASQANKAANKSYDTIAADLHAQERLIVVLGEQIEENKKAAELFEIDKAARIIKIKKGIGVLQDDIYGLEQDPVEQPKLPDQSKSRAIKEKLSEASTSYSVLQGSVKHNLEDIAALEKQVDALKKRQGVKKTCPTCNQEITDKEFRRQLADLSNRNAAVGIVHKNHLSEKDQIKASVDILKKELTDAEEQEAAAVQDYELMLEDYQAYASKLKALQAQLQREKTNLANEEKLQNTAADSLARLRTRRQTYRAEQSDLKEKAAQAAIELEQANFWVDAFREIRLSIIDSTLIELEMAASRHMAMLGLDDWGIKFDTERETQSGKVSHGFTVLLYPQGQDDPVKWESYSGGESQRVQLAVAFGLSEVLLARAGIAPSFEALDEPTRGLSSDGVGDLLEHLRDRALELGRAIYFIDHHSLDKGSFDGTLIVEKSAKGSSFRWQ